MKKEGSQSAMRLCMGSRRGFIARIKVGVLVMMVAVVVVIMVVGMMVSLVMIMKAIVVKGLGSFHICDKEDGDSKNGDNDDERNAGNNTNNYVGYEGFCDRHLVSIGVA